mgnify:CR=1 FL=1
MQVNRYLTLPTEVKLVSSLLLLYVWPSCTQSVVVVPSLSLVLRSVVLGVASSGNRRCSPRYQSSVLRVFSRLRALGCDETVPQCVSSLHGRLDFGWGVLRSGSRNRWSVLDGRIVFSPTADNRCNHTTSFVASDVAMYSTFVVDKAVHSWIFDFPHITPPP